MESKAAALAIYNSLRPEIKALLRSINKLAMIRAKQDQRIQMLLAAVFQTNDLSIMDEVWELCNKDNPHKVDGSDL
jgi:hypothetical protein